jgi:hypothetical protein
VNPKRAVRVLGGLASLALVACFVLLPPLEQAEAYHQFADQRVLLGVPNALNVLSNLPFFVVGLLGLVRLPAATSVSPAFGEPWERRAFALVFAALMFVALGSAYYHLGPSTDRLFWDRLPLAVVITGILGITIGERIDLRAGRRASLPLVALGMGSVMLWRATGDLRLYGFVQFFSLLAFVLLLASRPPRYSRARDLVGLVALYGAAKLCELADGALFRALGGTVSGHTLKHLLAAAGLGLLVRHLRLRRLVVGEHLP